MVGWISVVSSSFLNKYHNKKSISYKYGTKYRHKRETGEHDTLKRRSVHSGAIHLRLETPSHLFPIENYNTTSDSLPSQKKNITTTKHENTPGNLNNSENLISRMMLQLVHTPQIVAPNFKLIVRDANNNIISTNQTIAFPSCLYTGVIEGVPTAKVSLSTCGGMKKLVRILTLNKFYLA